MENKEFWEKYDSKYKGLYNSINEIIKEWGWKDFFIAVFNFQKEKKPSSGYVFKK